MLLLLGCLLGAAVNRTPHRESYTRNKYTRRMYNNIKQQQNKNTDNTKNAAHGKKKHPQIPQKNSKIHAAKNCRRNGAAKKIVDATVLQKIVDATVLQKIVDASKEAAPARCLG